VDPSGAAVIGIVSPGAMGSAVGACLRAGGHRVVATVAGRSERTRRLAAAAALDVLPSLEDVVDAAEVVLSVVPPVAALGVAAGLADAAGRTGARPLVADLNAVAPTTARAIEAALGAAGLDLVDGSISGPPPTGREPTRVYLSGSRAGELAALAAPGLELRVVGADVGIASAVKMSTASVYKGRVALLVQALVAAERYGVVEPVLDDLRDAFPEIRERGGSTLARAAAKSGRYVGEMREIAAAQAQVGLTPALFEAMAAVWAGVARTDLAGTALEEIEGLPDLREIISTLSLSLGPEA
jgi:3-hydroxyisobutyrate dehydrogenase-like beta-hydroxyacid dehydrogenase